MDKKYLTIIGLEVHIEPSLKSKMFCACSADHFGKKPNSQVCPTCMGLPGALPYANKAGIDAVVKLGLAVGSKISTHSRFYRKNYFYPDLPKGFQTSQLKDPFCIGGELLGKKIDHIHLEEDAGKLIHSGNESLIDFNRSGVALIEMVTEPVFHSVDEVNSFLKEVQLIARYCGISNADMEKGSMRLEANISLSTDGKLPNYKVELKNINSFKFLEKAINAEIKRQSSALDNGEELIQETRGFDEVKQTTFSQRVKSDSHDYKYFPEADLLPVSLHNSYILNLKSMLPELPQTKRQRFEIEYGINTDFINILVQDLDRANYFEECARLNNNYKLIADLMINKKLDETYPEPAGLVKKIVELSKVEYASGEETQNVVSKVISENENVVNDYKNGKVNVMGYFIGQVQKGLKGRGDIKMITEMLTKGLQK